MHTIDLADDLKRYGEDNEGSGAPDDLLARSPSSPTDRELIRLGQSLGLDLVQTVMLVLKRRWDALRVGQGDEKDNTGYPSGSYLYREFHAGAGGAADASELFDLFEEEAHLATGDGLGRDGFETLVHHCVLLNLHRLSFHGPEVLAFSASQQAQRELLSAATPREREAFWDRHRAWRQMEDEVGSLLLEVERQALENQQVERRWMETFGSVYLPLVEAEARFRSLEEAIARKIEDPGLTMRELEALEAEALEQLEQEMARHRRTLARSRGALPPGPGGMPLTDLELLGYEEECRRLLREIYRLTHPDVVGHHEFTDRQKEGLLGYYREAVALAGSAGIDDEEISLGMRSLASLDTILTRVRKIWEVKGLDVNEGAALRGNTLVELLEWLDARLAELEEQAKQVRADLLTVATDADVAEKRECLRTTEQIAAVTGQMERKRQWCEARIPALELRLQELFDSGSESDRTPL